MTVILGSMLREDDEKYSGISVEEYNLIKMAPFAKAQKTAKQIRMYINSNGKIFYFFCTASPF